MPINQPILAVNSSTRASVRTTAVPIVPKIPPAPYYELLEDVVVSQLQRSATTQPGVLQSGTYSVNVIASPVDGAVTGDQWSGASTLIVLVNNTDRINPGYYTFSFYVRGVTPAGGPTVSILFEEYDVFGSGVATVASSIVTATVGVWQRTSITAYMARPAIPYYIRIFLDAGESVYVANWMLEPGTSPSGWIDAPALATGVTANQDIYTEITQQPQREGQVVSVVEANSLGVSTAVLYVVVNISGTLTWKPVVGISKTIDSRTGLPYDSNLNFYSSLGDPPLNINVGGVEYTVTITLDTGSVQVTPTDSYYGDWFAQSYETESDIYPYWWAD
jgi:hypothetical protein